MSYDSVSIGRPFRSILILPVLAETKLCLPEASLQALQPLQPLQSLPLPGRDRGVTAVRAWVPARASAGSLPSLVSQRSVGPAASVAGGVLQL